MECICVSVCLCIYACVHVYILYKLYIIYAVCMCGGGSRHSVHFHITGLPKSGCSYSVLKVERTLNLHAKARQFTMTDELG